jgi:hypothetical protein
VKREAHWIFERTLGKPVARAALVVISACLQVVCVDAIAEDKKMMIITTLMASLPGIDSKNPMSRQAPVARSAAPAVDAAYSKRCRDFMHWLGMLALCANLRIPAEKC